MTQSLKLFTLITFLLVSVNVTAQSYVEIYNEGQEALKNGDVQTFRERMVRANKLRPNHPVIMYNLAKGHMLNNENRQAFQTLEVLIHFYASPSILDTSEFSILKILPEWEELSKAASEKQRTTITSEVAFEFDKPGFHPEGIAYDGETGDFYLTDIREGLIYRFNPKVEELGLFVDLKESGYWSALGVAIDPVDSDILWVTSSVMPQFSDYHEEIDGKSAVLKINKKTGQVIKSFQPKGERIFGDLTITDDGIVYISDSRNPEVFTIDSNDALKVVYQHEGWWNLQGLAFSDDEKFLYLSDYITGVYSIEISSGTIRPIMDENEWLRGGDGIYQKGGLLTVLQNGTTPKRVAQIRLDDKGKAMAETLVFPDQAREDINEPTLGTWVNNDLYYIGNSPWGYYGEDRNPVLDKWPILKIFKLKTQPASP
ncbi:SMP-30/gluconolactonase/LRE family protein [Gracilimonas sp. BCB1]|uniref:SMP-30/gluconolactonase/LRE family protein n=1 Tax=Gracilimonas sp. BCB1 TaxID=3152362 RepID=UPI0032D97757